MTPTLALTNSIATLLAADSTKLGAAAVKNVTLIQAAFTPGPGTDYASLTPADFTGSGVKTAPSGAQQSFTDGATGKRIVQLTEPVGGWHWTTADAVNLPQSIYGYVVSNADNSETYGSALFAQPITLTAAGQSIDIAQVRFTQNNPVLS